MKSFHIFSVIRTIFRCAYDFAIFGTLVPIFFHRLCYNRAETALCTQAEVKSTISEFLIGKSYQSRGQSTLSY